MKIFFRKDAELLPVETPVVGIKYHVSWAKRGCVWKCKSFDIGTGTALLITPKTRKEITVKISDLRHTRTNQAKIIQNKKIEAKNEEARNY